MSWAFGSGRALASHVGGTVSSTVMFKSGWHVSAPSDGEFIKTEEMREPHTPETNGAIETRQRQTYHSFRLLATMVQGTASALPEAWQSYQNVEEARSAAREMMRNHRVLRVAIVEDRIPLQFVEWVGR